jgi:hypothetical protein
LENWEKYVLSRRRSAEWKNGGFFTANGKTIMYKFQTNLT